MKKLFSLVAILIGMTGGADAQNALIVEDFTLPQTGGEMNITLSLAEAGVYNAYQFKIDTPEGIQYVVDEENDVECTLGVGHHTSHQATAHWNPSTKVFALGVASMKSSLLDGTTVRLSIPLGATTATVGTVFRLKLNDITFIRQAGEPDVLDDVFVNVTIGEPDDGRLKFDETSATLPKYTAGDKADITMKRTIKGGEWSTIVLPFNLTKKNAEAAFGSDVQFAQFAGFDVDYGDDEENVVPLGITVNLTNYSIPARGNLAGGTPLLIKTGADIDEIQLDGVTLTEGVKDVEKADEYGTPGLLTGTLVKTTIPADGLFINSNQFWYSTGKTNVKAFRCWFELGAVLNQETDFGARVMLNFLDGEASGVENIDHSPLTIEHSVYDLQGRKIENGRLKIENSERSQIVNGQLVNRKCAKGVYIVNGKKVVK